MTPTTRPRSEHSPSSPGEAPAVRLGLVLIVGRARDYPAAHSMDTHWYTVDVKGNVAVFDAGSSGPVPIKAKAHESPDLVALLRQLGGGRTLVTEEDEEDFDNEDAYKELAGLGLFVFQCIAWETDFIDTHVRCHQPARPLHLDQLPPRLRKEFAQVPLPVADFAAAKEVQIVEHVPCAYYWEAVGYYAPGHKEVRPILGRETEYREALPAFKKQYPKLKFADAPEPDDQGNSPPKKGKTR
jgi:hypothetical protein